MAEKKRKLETPAEDVAATEPEGKKAKRDSNRDAKKEKKDKKSKQKDAVDIENGAEGTQVNEKKDKREKKDKEEKKDKKDKKEKKERKEKKEKKSKDVTSEEEPAEETNATEPEPEVSEQPADAMDVDGDTEIKEKSEKEKKKEKKKAKKAKKQMEGGKQEPEQSQEQEAQESAAPNKKAARFIVFVGNLPYSANTESLKAHFEKIQPISVRVATQPDKPTKSRGFGFVEFDNYDRMKTCLKLYHHSSFDDGKYPPRRINVELTAGGGGKSEHRKAKIDYKNQKLTEERKRQGKEIQTEKVRKTKTEETGADDYADVHPSRRGRMA
ncbi:hypothetical protein ASPVEDRAFT_40189 [Aspergillus versicolor CBS 583.65]|uniref:RRM domain-containing protein n=1 Tax=Aspergillus versicolor CBS 583.65 TaxID=1036611 RepID=A0A1L9PGK2_ASPVE|nr:uncharacterized protein ASPVEDRAFT_40189 [Aspergillus versicolor CBS 583.65]OJJ00647.1 hypothetical protein ASPVEDRAFT_40189 [Aspergillus versicolor CBS 583.65]